MFRRNGKPTSCEPCRLSKIRCDHTRPTCRRCQTRGMIERCFYHPAPLTRRSGNAHRQGRDMLLDQNGGSSIEAAGDFFHGNGAQAEYLGSTSFVSALPEPMPGILDSSSFHPDEADTMRLSIAKPRLARFFHFSGQLQELITRYYNRSQFLIIPRPLILDPISKISDSLKDAEDENLSPFESVWTHLMANLTKPLSAVADTITADEFYGWFTGSNLRWEFVGVISALAGLASSYPETREVFDHEALTVPEMLTVSNICLETCEQHNRMNDLTVWLRYTNFTLASSLYGDTSMCWFLSSLQHRNRTRVKREL